MCGYGILKIRVIRQNLSLIYLSTMSVQRLHLRQKEAGRLGKVEEAARTKHHRKKIKKTFNKVKGNFRI